MDNNVGKITLATEVNTKGVDEGLVDIERKVTAKGFADKFSRMFNGLFSKIGSGVSKATSSILKGLSSIFSSIGGITSLIASISLVGIIGMVLLAANYSETAKGQLEEIATIVMNLADTLANLILPIAEAIVDIIYEAVKWIADILNDWFGIDLFAKRTDKSLKSSVKSAKALRKQLLGFDEMNILNKDGTIGGIGSGGSSGGSSGGQPKSSETTTKNKVMNTLAGIGEGVIDTIGTKLLLLGGGGGYILWSLLFGEKNGPTRTQKAVTKFLRNVNSQLLGAKAKYKDGLVEVKTINGDLLHYTEDEFSSLMNELGYTTDKKTGEIKKIVLTTNVDIEKSLKENANNIEDNWLGVGFNIKKEFNGDNKNSVKGSLTNAFWEIQNSGNATSGETKKSWVQSGNDIINKFTGNNGVQGIINAGLKGIEVVSKTSSKQSADNIKEQYGGLPSWVENNVFVKLLREFGVLGSDTGQTFGKGLKDAVNKVIDKIETTINSVFTTATNMFKKFGISVPVPKVKLPRLAKGGIINQPGRGVNYGIANIGERGREGVIPLDNQSAMNTLANEISKRLVINLTNVTEIDGRELARITTQVMNDMQFESNGGVM